MNCQNHPERPATAYCRACGKPVCEECRRDAFGTVYCADHAPAPAPPPAPPIGADAPPLGPTVGTTSGPAFAVPPAYAVPPTGGAAFAAPAPGSYAFADVSPGLAFFLGCIPGVGAIYNGQYAKGIVHAVIWGMLMSMANSRASQGLEPLFVILVMAWWFYMAFEAYHTARKRRAGEPVDEYSSILNLSGGRSHVPVAGVSLIVLGTLLLLNKLELLDFEYVAKFWPVLLIAAGAYLLAGRFLPGAAPKEHSHERQ
jgi:Domain of unknown function (DUF5668)/B-box zinc finger